MKIFHTADWHIGKLLHKENLIEEQREVLTQFIEHIDREKPDVIIVAGDIYDTTIPRIEAIELLNKVINEIISRNIKMIIISGNHDSSDRLSFGNELFTRNGLYMVTDFRYIKDPIVLEDEYGKVNFYPYPYMSIARGRNEIEKELENENIEEFEEQKISERVNNIEESDNIKSFYEIDSFDKLAKASIGLSEINMNKDERNIAIYHGFIVNLSSDNMSTGDSSTGNLTENETDQPVTSGSERPLSIGGTDYINADVFSNFDYTALGHLHGPQKVKTENIMYSGSLMKYSFSEQNQKKGYLEIVLREKGDMDISLREIYPNKDVRIIEGDMETLLNQPPSDDYIMIRLSVKGEVYEPKARLNKVFKNLLHLEIVREETLEGSQSREIKDKLKRKDIIGLFKDFYEYSTNKEFTDDKREIIENLKEELEGRIFDETD